MYCWSATRDTSPEYRPRSLLWLMLFTVAAISFNTVSRPLFQSHLPNLTLHGLSLHQASISLHRQWLVSFTICGRWIFFYHWIHRHPFLLVSSSVSLLEKYNRSSLFCVYGHSSRQSLKLWSLSWFSKMSSKSKTLVQIWQYLSLSIGKCRCMDSHGMLKIHLDK